MTSLLPSREGPKIAPSWASEGFLDAKKPYVEGPLTAQDGPKTALRRPKETPQTAKRATRRPKRAPRRLKWRRLFEASWGVLGASWGPLGGLLGHLGDFLGPLEGLLGACLRSRGCSKAESPKSKPEGLHGEGLNMSPNTSRGSLRPDEAMLRPAG